MRCLAHGEDPKLQADRGEEGSTPYGAWCFLTLYALSEWPRVFIAKVTKSGAAAA